MKSLVSVLALVTVVSAGVRAQDAPPPVAPPAPSASAVQARTLVDLLTGRNLQAVATKDPHAANRYVAALYVPGAELLVVRADYPVPALLDKKLKDGQFQDVYIELQSAAATSHKLFVEDLQANGLQAASAPNEPFDIVTVDGKDLRFNGDWAAQNLTQEEYTSRFTALDAQYSEMLSALVAHIRATGPKTTER